jgi:hypothetical protein
MVALSDSQSVSCGLAAMVQLWSAFSRNLFCFVAAVLCYGVVLRPSWSDENLAEGQSSAVRA